MPIAFNCACGKLLRAADEHAGRRVKCPECHTPTIVPAPLPLFEVVEDLAQPLVSPPPLPAKAKPIVKAQIAEDDEDDRRGYGVKSERDDDDRPRERKKPDFRSGSGRRDEEEDRPRKKRRKKRRPPPQEDNRIFEARAINAGVGGGVLMMLVAVVWFVVGLMNDWIFFYPPILFILGLIAFIKGMTGEE